MREDVIRAHAELPALCEHIHLPLQSGSSAVLKRMRRTYDRQRYMDRVALIREHVPDCAITTDIIVGFPGETEADFEQTLEVAEEVGYDGAFTFVFSPRRETEAATMDGQLPHPVKVERMERLVEVVQRRAKERAQRFVGRTMEVLVEGTSRTDQTRLRGRTRHNKAVNFEGVAEAGQFVDVEIRRRHFADAERGIGKAPHSTGCTGALTVLAIFGPTGVGKTGVAIELAKLLRERGEDPVAISCDALQVYEGLGTLTGVATAAQQAELEHRLIGFVPVTARRSTSASTCRWRMRRWMRRWRREDADRGGGDRALSAGGAGGAVAGQGAAGSGGLRALVAGDPAPDDDLRARHGPGAALRADRRSDRGDRRRRGRGGGAAGRGGWGRRGPRARRSASTSCSPATSSR